MYVADNPLIVQSDRTVLVEVASPRYVEARDALARFAELERSPEHVHTYRLTPLSLWNAAASGMRPEEVVAALVRLGKHEMPENVRRDVVDVMARYGRLQLVRDGDALLLDCDDEPLLVEILHHRATAALIAGRRGDRHLEVVPAMRGPLKQALLRIGYPAEDLAGYEAGEALAIHLRASTAADGAAFRLRGYQSEAVDVFHAGGDARGGSGVIVLPCGAGKTVVGMGVMAAVGASTLILTPSTVAARQWIDELADKTTLDRDAIGEYTGLAKQLRPVTVSTYQTMTYRPRKSAGFPHLALFDQRDWGLIVYDEVHLLPAPVFRATASIQARRRLGLTATLVREDGRSDDVFSLIGPKRYDVPWRELEAQGWIATAVCAEVRIAMPEESRFAYAVAGERNKYGIAARNPDKADVVAALLRAHAGDEILVIGQYLDQLEDIARRFELPLITGATPVADRRAWFDRLRRGEIRRLAMSKVGNFSIDLPDVNVMIQISGTFGSRQEEAQRLGRILRPKRDGRPARFYTIVSRDTCDETFAQNRQRYLTEQGYRYRVLYRHEIEDAGQLERSMSVGRAADGSTP